MIAWGLVTFNRPIHTRRVIDVLREHHVQPLYVFVDGPRNAGDHHRVHQVQAEVEKIDWTRPTVFVRPGNIGLRRSVVGAVDEMLSSHDTMVLIEDDLVPGPWFFRFMEDTLSCYRYREQVMSISGYTVPISAELLDGYPWEVYFHPRIGSWGWGTWVRAWTHYVRDFEIGQEVAHKRGLDLRTIGMDVPSLVNAKIDAWTPGWLLGVGLRGGVCAYPVTSHIQNLGFDGSGVHCGKTDHWQTPIAEDWKPNFPTLPFVDERICHRVNSFYGGSLQPS